MFSIATKIRAETGVTFPCAGTVKPLHDNIIEFEVTGEYGLFTDPITRMGGEKCSYQIPTYEALHRLTESIFWKPAITWVVTKCRVCSPISQESVGIKTLRYAEGGNDLSFYTYLTGKPLRYQVQARFEWNANYHQFRAEWENENKYHEMAKRSVQRGGYRDIFIGTRECMGYVKPCSFGEGEGAYDHIRELHFGQMFHSFTYPNEAYNEATAGKLTANYWRPAMRCGVIEFPKPEECPSHVTLRDYPFDRFENNREKKEAEA